METGGRPRFVAGVEKLDECALHAKLWACPHCDALHHPECWAYLDGCSRFGCPEAPRTVLGE